MTRTVVLGSATDRQRTVYEAVAEGGRTCRILVAATAAAGSAGLLLHGRYSDRLFRLQGEPAVTFCATFAAVAAHGSGGGVIGGVPAPPPAALQRVGGAFLVASACALASGMMR